MSTDTKYENKYDDEIEERVRKPLEAVIDLPKESRHEKTDTGGSYDTYHTAWNVRMYQRDG